MPWTAEDLVTLNHAVDAWDASYESTNLENIKRHDADVERAREVLKTLEAMME